MSVTKLSLAVLAAGLFATSAHAADLIIADPVVDMASPKAWEAYIGVIGSAGRDPIGTYGGIGVVVGADIDVSDMVFLGGEGRIEGYFDNTGYTGTEGAVRGRVGVHATDAVDLYLAGGFGHFVGNGANPSFSFYEVAGGAEFDIAEDLAVRAEVAASGPFNGGFNTYQANLGLLWKF